MACILVVDDDALSRAVLSRSFSESGHEVLAVGNGPEGLELAKSRLPDIAILDVDMPIMDGYEVCSRLRENPSTRRMAILMLSGLDRLPQAMKGMARGADDYLTKPFDAYEVVARAEVLLRLSGD